MACMVVQCFQKSMVITKTLSRPRTSQKLQSFRHLVEYLFTPFGLSNAAQNFQRMMDRTTDGLEGVFQYIDDSRVGSMDRQTHLRHLEAFFSALASNGLAINLENAFLQPPLLRFLDT
jgi:hypothetical protein